MNLLKEFEEGDVILEMLAKRQLLQFYSTYSALGDLLTRFRLSTHAPVAYTTPPGQTTVPENPNNSDGSTSSTESKGEPYAQDVAKRFLDATLSTVTRWIDRNWVNPDAKLYFRPQYIHIISF